MGQEERWWREQRVDPLPIARRLWQQSLMVRLEGEAILDDAAADVDRT